MDVKTRNDLLLQAKLDVPNLFPQLKLIEEATVKFEMNFGLSSLPDEPGLILIRGARQMGKSTWMESQIRNTIIHNGAGSAVSLNADTLLDAHALEEEIRNYLPFLSTSSSVPRIFIDEITAVPGWELALKRLYDQGETRKVLIITTGSKAIDLRRGTERLPGRKGRLSRTNYIFTHVDYSQFKQKCTQYFKDDTLLAYMITGGSPIAINELIYSHRIPEYVTDLTRDWILGECAAQGRSRNLLNWVIAALLKRGGTSVSLAKLAQECGAANNTVVRGYVDLLGDLLCISAGLQIDTNTGVPLPRKSHKYHWTHLLAAFSFHPSKPRTIQDYKSFPNEEQGAWLEWLVSQELWRRGAVSGHDQPEVQYFWQSKSHELDFREREKIWIEVKKGATSALEFAWFPKVFPKSKLCVISSSRFSVPFCDGITFEDFLLGE
jgi:predicted AAA+ superfamily ATPase